MNKSILFSELVHGFNRKPIDQLVIMTISAGAEDWVTQDNCYAMVCTLYKTEC